MTEQAASGLADLRALVQAGGAVVLSGAGISTDSGIPDYRGPSGALRARLPMTIQEFRGSAAARRRYWARSYLGWRRVAGARPNVGHRAVAELERRGAVAAIITQNVDGLHQAAGAAGVIELHGGLRDVVCLACGEKTSRARLHARLLKANRGFAPVPSSLRPDGDAELSDEQLAGFRMVGCERCEADMLKPDIVFFGENVPRPRVQRCLELVGAANSLIVLGSSLTVMSGLRFVLRAARDGIPIAIVNRGATRGDEHAQIKLDAALRDVLPALLEPA